MDWLTEPLSHGFVRQALVAVVLVGVNCAVVGTYVVLRRMAFIGDALAHTVLPGLAFAYLRGLNLFFGAVVAAVVTALGIGWLSRRGQVREDTAIGVVFSAMFALGVILMSSAGLRDFHGMLLGSLLDVTVADLWAIAALSLPVYGLLFVLHKELELTSFDPTYSELIGCRPDRLRYLLLVATALTVVAAIQAVGVILTPALLITPAAAATQLSRRLPAIMALGAGVAVLSGVAGLLLSFHFDLPSGATIVLCCTACFLAAWSARRAGLVRLE